MQAIVIQKTNSYPTRYAAFDRQGVLFVHEHPKKSGGHEWAVFSSPEIYGSIVSYQDKGLLIEVCSMRPIGSSQVRFSRTMGYDYQLAESVLLEEILKASAQPRPELSFDSRGINGSDEFRTRIATFTSTEAAQKYGPLFEAAPLLMLELKEVCAQYDALLTAHAKPFGWGRLVTENARKLIAKVEGSK